jgi:hypothetical protein
MDPRPPSRTPTETATEFFAELDRLGEAQVRQLLETGAFASDNVPFVREWLLRVDEDRARRQAERE